MIIAYSKYLKFYILIHNDISIIGRIGSLDDYKFSSFDDAAEAAFHIKDSGSIYEDNGYRMIHKPEFIGYANLYQFEDICDFNNKKHMTKYFPEYIV